MKAKKNTRIRSWYITEYPTDELGVDICPVATFAGLWECMLIGMMDVYDYIDVHDSIVRERIFEQVAALYCGGNYDIVYDTWLNRGIVDRHNILG